MKAEFVSFLVLSVSSLAPITEGFNLVFMGTRRGKGNLNRQLPEENANMKRVASINKGKGQEITGVTLPASGNIKGWEFGEATKMACANVNGQFYAIQGDCPRCGFDLWKGDLINDDAFEDIPRIACPTCSTTFGLRTGKPGPPLKRTGLQSFVSGLAKSATSEKSANDAQTYQITRDEDGRVYCRERNRRQLN
jgi:nitrite reductase/ring-hydroxylating ferredoxin subunit